VTDTSLIVDWGTVVAELVDRGWSRVPRAASAELVAILADEDRRTWRRLEEEGLAQPDGSGAYLPFDQARPAVRHAGDELTASLSAAAAELGLPPLPGFDEVTWTSSPSKRTQSSAYRDPPHHVGVIAVFTLRGIATIRVLTGDGQVMEWATGPGHLVLLRGRDWPGPGMRGPRHSVDPPALGERMILTLRATGARVAEGGPLGGTRSAG
jgi:hypothetical protein